MRWIFLVAALVVVLSVWPSSREDRRHASGVALLGPLDIGPFVRERERMGEAAFDAIALAYSDARQLAEREAESFGVPWMDLANRRLVVRVTGPDGAGQVRRPTSAPIAVVATDRSFAYLRSIMDGSIDDPSLGIRGGRARVWTIGIDDESQRVVFETDRLNEEFVVALARAYGPDAVAVRIDPFSGPACMPVLPLDPAAAAPGTCGYVPPPVVGIDASDRGRAVVAVSAAVLSVFAIASFLVVRRSGRASG